MFVTSKKMTAAVLAITCLLYTSSTQKVQLQNFANWPKHSLCTLFHFPFSKGC